MSLLLHGDCLENLHGVDDNSVDLIFCDLPYGQTSCKWDCKIDLAQLWDHFMRIKKLNTPLFFTTTTKFGCDLIQSAPKKCYFRYDLVWVKSAPAGFLCAKKMPMRKHEMIYVFYEKLPFYDLSSHQHKFIKETVNKRNGKDGIDNKGMIKNRSKTEIATKYEPPLPVSVVKEPEELDKKYQNKGGLYSKISRNGLLKAEPHYEPPLPVSVVKEPETGEENPNLMYEPEPESLDIIKKVERKSTYGDIETHDLVIGETTGQPRYEPPLPVSVVKENKSPFNSECYGTDTRKNPLKRLPFDGRDGYDPPLPTTLLEIKSTRGKHSTEKPVALMEWILKYYSKEGDVVLDPTMGSGSTGVACKNMNRNFIGIEKDPEIYEVAVNRIEN
tara:strand:- start:992 stop:2149 length:1158 start_codon:yes stop_codon:yes gene_type:complete